MTSVSAVRECNIRSIRSESQVGDMVADPQAGRNGRTTGPHGDHRGMKTSDSRVEFRRDVIPTA